MRASSLDSRLCTRTKPQSRSGSGSAKPSTGISGGTTTSTPSPRSSFRQACQGTPAPSNARSRMRYTLSRTYSCTYSSRPGSVKPATSTANRPQNCPLASGGREPVRADWPGLVAHPGFPAAVRGWDRAAGLTVQEGFMVWLLAEVAEGSGDAKPAELAQQPVCGEFVARHHEAGDHAPV